MSSGVRVVSASEGRPPRIVGPAPGDWFFYGSLKPSQPGWDQIIDLVEARADADAVGWTVTQRDGLPLLEQWDEQEDAAAPGIVVRAKAGCEDELKTRLKRIENDAVYRVTNVRVRVKPGEGQLEGVEHAWAWVAKDHGRDRGLPLPEGWGLEHDELFARGFPVLYDYLRPCIDGTARGERDDHDYWTSFIFPLEGGFLVLCSMLERLAIAGTRRPARQPSELRHWTLTPPRRTRLLPRGHHKSPSSSPTRARGWRRSGRRCQQSRATASCTCRSRLGTPCDPTWHTRAKSRSSGTSN